MTIWPIILDSQPEYLQGTESPLSILLAPIGTEQARLTIPVADGCGFNRYRDARGICRRKYVITRHQGRQPVYTGCGGLNSHRVCNLYGHCWMVCD